MAHRDDAKRSTLHRTLSGIVTEPHGWLLDRPLKEGVRFAFISHLRAENGAKGHELAAKLYDCIGRAITDFVTRGIPGATRAPSAANTRCRTSSQATVCT